MASRQEAAGEGGSSFLDQLLRRPSESNNNNEQLESAASPSTSFAALVSSYDDLSGPNPWQSNLSTPSSPRDQHSFFQYPWMQDILGQQRAANSHGVDSSRSSEERSAVPARRNAIRRRREQVRQLHCLAPSEAYSLFVWTTNRNCFRWTIIRALQVTKRLCMKRL